MLWMPLFLGEELGYENSEIANVASAYEIGNMFGGIFLGFLSDRCYSKRSPIGCIALIISFVICLTLSFRYKDIQSE
jgi:sugar phosphate permease